MIICSCWLNLIHVSKMSLSYRWTLRQCCAHDDTVNALFCVISITIRGIADKISANEISQCLELKTDLGCIEYTIAGLVVQFRLKVLIVLVLLVGYQCMAGSMSWWLGRACHLICFATYMMTSSNGTIFRVTGPLCGEFTGHRWITRTKASDAELWCFLWSASE